MMPNIEVVTIVFLKISIGSQRCSLQSALHILILNRSSQKTSTTAFYNMLTTDMVKKREKVVTITGWDIEVL